MPKTIEDIILVDRYKILDVLGEGGSGKTYRAIDKYDRSEVAIKILSLRGMGDWKTLELFEREAKILAQLAHPAIPRYLDYFQTEVAGEDTFCLVQAIAPGRSLTAWIESRHLFSEIEIRQIATQILDILIYLQAFTPPIIHRDLKPQNLLLSESGNISLVDFGAVRDTYHLTVTGGSTIVGTYGYMAPEQFRGQAVLATDLYGLGTTLLYLISGQDPADLPVRQMKIDFRQRVKTSPDFANWIDRLLEPIPEDRYRNATQALSFLNGKVCARVPRPKHPISRIYQQGNNLKIVIPPIWLATRSSQITFFTATFLLLSALFGWWLMRIAILDERSWWLFLLGGIVVIPWMIRVLWHYFAAVTCQSEIAVISRELICKTKIAGMSVKHIIKIEDIKSIRHQEVSILSLKDSIQFKISGQQYYPYNFGNYLEYTEQRWLISEILEHLRLCPEIEEIDRPYL